MIVTRGTWAKGRKESSLKDTPDSLQKKGRVRDGRLGALPYLDRTMSKRIAGI